VLACFCQWLRYRVLLAHGLAYSHPRTNLQECHAKPFHCVNTAFILHASVFTPAIGARSFIPSIALQSLRLYGELIINKTILLKQKKYEIF